MTGHPSANSQTFADFMFAVVIGVAFSQMPTDISAATLIPTVFLLLVILEAFFRYQTQVKPYTGVFEFTGIQSFLFEIGILLAWYLSFLTRLTSPRWSNAFLLLFFLLEWLAGVTELGAAKRAGKAWIVKRDNLFWLSMAAIILIMSTRFRTPIGSGRYQITVDWPLLFIVWLIQIQLWWGSLRDQHAR